MLTLHLILVDLCNNSRESCQISLCWVGVARRGSFGGSVDTFSNSCTMGATALATATAHADTLSN